MKKIIFAIIIPVLCIACSKKQVVTPSGAAIIEYRLTSTDTSTYLITYTDSSSKLTTESFSGDVWSKIITKSSPDFTVSDFLVENKDPWLQAFSGQLTILINGKYAANQMAQFNQGNTDFFCYSPVN